MGYIGQPQQRLEVLPVQESGTGAPPEPGGPRADELPELRPAGTRTVRVTVRAEPAEIEDTDASGGCE